ncbi:hypothetical protein D3C73_1646360 [compost metagenome]
MTVFDAPTSRMIPVSRRRLNADSRMVVVINKTAQKIITAATPMAATDAPFIQEKMRSSTCRWSLTVSTPG